MTDTTHLVRQILAAPRRIAWGYFDAPWYRERYAIPAPREAGEASADSAADLSDALLLEHYLTAGQRQGHSPNPVFDEAWYRRRYPDIGRAIASGLFLSGFHHYCYIGFSYAQPNFLFEELQYRRLNPVVAALAPKTLLDEAWTASPAVNGYDHFLRGERGEGPRGIWFFDAAFYEDQLPEPALPAIDRLGAFAHYLDHAAAGTDEIRPSLYFDPRYYRDRYPEAAAAVAEGRYHTLLHHYLAAPEAIDHAPLPHFSESYYLTRYPDVAAAVRHGGFRRGYEHFLLSGARERRQPAEGLDLAAYATESVLAAVDDGRYPDAFAHFLDRERDAPPLAALRIGLEIARGRARRAMPLHARAPLDFTVSGVPPLTAVMVVRGEVALALQSLAALRMNDPGEIGLVLVALGTAFDDHSAGSLLRGAEVLRLPAAGNAIEAVNEAIAGMRGAAILLLRAGVSPGPGAVRAGLNRLRSDPAIGAAGGLVYRADGRIEEAGGVIWRNAAISHYLAGAEADRSEGNFTRDVDFCSGQFLMLRTEAVRRLGGLEPGFGAHAEGADIDLCLRLWRAGQRVVYDPAITSETAAGEAAHAALRRYRGQALLRARHAEALRLKRPANDRLLPAARMRANGGLRILFIEDRIPLRAMGSGYVRSNDIVNTMTALGYQVTVFPVLEFAYRRAALVRDFADTVEVMHRQSLAGLETFLGERARCFDIVWIARTHNLVRLIPILDKHAHILPYNRLIVDTEAVAAVREQLRGRVLGDVPDEPPQAVLLEAIRREMVSLDYCQTVIAVNRREADLLSAAGHGNARVVGHRRDVRLTETPFVARRGLLFAGAIYDATTPNYDSLIWFLDAIWPRLRATLPEDAVFQIAGYQEPAVDMSRFKADPRIELLGWLDDLTGAYEAARVFIAPTRFAAGMPYKVHEAASHGLPVVATELLGAQLGWRHGEDLLTAPETDPARFAAEVARLYLDPALWQHLRDQAAQRVREECSPEAYRDAVRKALEAPGT